MTGGACLVRVYSMYARMVFALLLIGCLSIRSLFRGVWEGMSLCYILHRSIKGPLDDILKLSKETDYIMRL